MLRNCRILHHVARRIRSRRLNVFISYRRKESSGYSGRIYDRLRAALPDAEVFIDVEAIDLGARWRDELAEHLRAADVVLVLIGEEWRTLQDASGRRRLDDPEDVTRWELETALALGKRLVPVLLDSAKPLAAEELPQTLRPLTILQAVRIRHEAFDAGLEDLIARLTGRRLRDEVTVTRARWLLERSKRWAVPVIALAIVLLAWTRFFDLLTLDTRMATWTLALADAMAPLPLSTDLVLIGIGPEQPRADPAMRARYGELIAALTRAGTRNAVLDIYFHVPKATDAELAQSLQDARDAGMQVFFGFVEEQQGIPRAVPQLAAAASAVGLACAGRRLGYAVSVPIAFGIRRAGEHWLASPLPALSLLGAAGNVRIEGVDPGAHAIDVRGAGGSSRHAFSLLGNEIVGKQACAAIVRGTRVAELIVRISPLETLRARRVAFEDVLAGRIASARLHGKIAVIGYETDDETFQVAYGLGRETRFGYELQADAINGIVSRRITRFAGPGVQAATAAVFATLGAAFGIRLRGRSRGAAVLTLGIFAIAYVSLAVLLAATEDLLLNSAYDFSAFAFAFVLFRYLSRRWMK